MLTHLVIVRMVKHLARIRCSSPRPTTLRFVEATAPPPEGDGSQ